MTTTNTNRTIFVIVAEHTFGTVNPERPTHAQILASKPQRGAVLNWMDGEISLEGQTVRSANLADFMDYRIASAGYAADSKHYAMPTA